jgi:beta-glucosidase
MTVMLSGLFVGAAGAASIEADGGGPTGSPDVQADRLESRMTQDEKLTLVRGYMPTMNDKGEVVPHGAIFSAGYVPGIASLGIPPLSETDASLGIAYIMGRRHDGATPLPSGLAIASSWDTGLAYRGGAMIGREAHRKGFDVLLAGGANLARDPRGGRNFEYLGEDPLLTGMMAGAAVRGTQDQHVVSTLKHFAFNDQETGRKYLDARIDPAAARESDLLAFEIAIEQGRPGAVMCGYNRINGPYACENGLLLNRILKGDWRFPGWVLSDWGAVHSLNSVLDGLDQQSGAQLDPAVYFTGPLATAARSQPAYRQRLDEMAHRILRSLFAVGVMNDPPHQGPIDAVGDEAVAQQVAEEGIVLLKNRDHLLPLQRRAMRVAVIGGHADIGVLSGGGSSQVCPDGGPAWIEDLGTEHPQHDFMRRAIYHPSSPYRAILKTAPMIDLAYDNGTYPSSAADLARRADIAIVFATQWMQEGEDAPDLTLPEGQDATIAAVVAANPHTIVVLETGGPVLMPWLKRAGAVLEAWYPGGRGGEAITRVLFGDVDPSGRLPMTFPASMDQLPRRAIPGWRLPAKQPFEVNYDEGADVGYRWDARHRLRPLFSFGAGLSYSRFSYDALAVTGGGTVTARFTVTNRGNRGATDVPQVYLVGGARHARERLIGWQRVTLAPGRSAVVTVTADPRLLADWDEAAHGWRLHGGFYSVAVGASATDLRMHRRVKVAAALLPP